MNAAISRRTWLWTLAAIAGSRRALRGARLQDVGVQLWSVHDQLDKGLDPILTELSAIGYTQVEVFFPPGKAVPIEPLVEALKRRGMQATSWHRFPPDLRACQEITV